jgi:hypothetical protein
MAVKKDAIDSKKLELFKALVTTVKGLELKGASMPYVSVNGHMFSFLDKDGNLALRLAEDEREKFILKYNSRLFPAHGTVLKEYVEVPPKLLKDFPNLKPYFLLSHKYVSTLKPKIKK